MKDWREMKVGNVARVLSGFAFKSSDFNTTTSTIPVIKIKNIKNGDIDLSEADFVNESCLSINSKYHVTKNDILISLTGSHITQPNSVVGRVALYQKKEKSLLNQRAGKIIPDETKVDGRFLYSFLLQDFIREEIALRAKGAANQANISPSDVEDIKILLPPLPTQRKIASILSAYDDLIENNLQRIKLLEETAQITYEEWFVKFTVNGEKLKMKNGLPVGWERKKIGDVCKATGGGTPSKAISKYWEGGTITWFSPTDLSKSNSIFQIDSANKITEEGLKNSSAKLLQPNSFMFSSRATIGLFGIVDKPFCTNQGFICATPQKDFHKEFLFYNFLSRVEEFKGHATGSTFPELTKTKFNALEIIFPDDKILIKFHELIKPVHELIGSLTHQNRLLKEARDILLPRLMTGKIEVGKWKLNNHSIV